MEVSMANLALHYMYRDGANYKESAFVVFANPLDLSSKGVEELLRECLFSDENFIAENVSLPPCYFDEDDAKHAHGLHEYLSIE
jgi:hypothetical protein